MNKAELINAIAEKNNFTLVDTKAIVDSLFETITETLEGGEYVNIAKFGTFRLREVAPRTGVCRFSEVEKPWTRPAHVAITFKSSKELKERVA